MVTDVRAEDTTGIPGPQRDKWWLSDGRRLVLVAFLLGLIVRVLTAWFSGAAQPGEIRYITIAEGILAGRGFEGLDNRFPSIIQPPVFPLTLALTFILPGSHLFLGRALSIILGALIVFPVASLGRRLFGERVAGRAALLAAVYPVLSHVSSAALTESLFALLVCAAALSVGRMLDARSTERVFRLSLPAGLYLGLAFLTRPEGLAYLAALIPALPILLRVSGWEWRRAIKAMIAPVVGFVLIVSPYTTWVRYQTGQWMLAPKAALIQVHQGRMQEGQREQWKEPFGSTLFFERVKFGLNADATAVTSHEQFLKTETVVSGGILANEEGGAGATNPLMALGTVGRNLAELYFEGLKYGYVMPTILLLFAGMGLLSQPWAGTSRRWVLLTGTFIAGSLSFLLTHVESRFLYSAIPFVLPFMAEGWRRAEVWLLATMAGAGAQRAALQRRIVPVVFGALVMGLTLVHLLPSIRITGRLWAEHREIGRWLLATAGPGRSVMAATPAVAFYAQARFEVLPYGDLEEVVKYARHKGVEYLVADRAEFSSFRPQLVSLLIPERPHPGLDLVEVRHRGTPQAILLYRVADSAEQVRD